jgi:hypothetical protein
VIINPVVYIMNTGRLEKFTSMVIMTEKSKAVQKSPYKRI